MIICLISKNIPFFNHVLVPGNHGANGQTVTDHVMTVYVLGTDLKSYHMSPQKTICKNQLKESGNVLQEQLHFVMVQNVTCKRAMTSRAMIGQIKNGLIGPHGANVRNHVMVAPESEDDFAKTSITVVETEANQTMKLFHATKIIAQSTLAEKN